MSDFMKWLYLRYIRPYLKEVPREDYAFWIDLLQNELDGGGKEALEKTGEFIAIHAFLLGLETGRGLPDVFNQGSQRPCPVRQGRP